MVLKKIAVLLAAYNGEEYLHEQINSILGQKNVNVTIYISLDRSVDRSLSIVQNFADANINVNLLDYGDRFGSAGKNFFHLVHTVNVDEYDYVAFADQDDIWPANKLAKAIEKLQEYDCYSANVTAFWDDGRAVFIDKAQKQCEWDFLFEAAGPGCTYVFKREVAIQFKVWLLNCYEQVSKDITLHDWLLYAFARSHGYSWFIDPDSMMRYRQHANNQVGTNNSFAAAKKRLKLIKDKWYRQQVNNIITHLGLQDTFLYSKGVNNGYLGNLYLLLHIVKLRRRFRDRCALALVLLFNVF